jgi:dTDP-4-dehydrorhamnose reductase
MRELGVAPIIGLVHHGSGPRHTSLLDPRFADGLAEYARAVAERYPWVDTFTPVNEPLTTARFSALYGHWYPHATDPRDFAAAMLNQCRATVLAMRAIRAVNPHARLLQTEDLGRTYSTPLLAYQAAFENDRRWLTFDLLTGRLQPADRMWRYFRDLGVPEAELRWFGEHATPPEVLGINHYLTSERFLDPRLSRYPESTWGGNGRHRYADVEAARVLPHGAAGPASLLREAWERYALPLAVTEVHNGCTREEQLRWLLEVWTAATALRGDGVDVRAVTIWALLGSFDWDSLLTADRGRYEPGAFDIRGPAPRPTALARLTRELAGGRPPSSPVLGDRGWWHRPTRLAYGPPVADCAVHQPSRGARSTVAQLAAAPILITGAGGTLGRAVERICRLRGLDARGLTRADADISDPAAVAAVIAEHRPWAVVNAAGYVRVDDAESDASRCLLENADGAAVLADACATAGVALVTFSSDLVFDGRQRRPYVESDRPAPLSVYGRSKLAAEERVLDRLPSALVIRTSAFFGLWDDHNFVVQGIRRLMAGEPWAAATDTVSPTYVPDLVNASLDLLIDRERGIWHLANPGAIGWAGFARRVAELVGHDPAAVVETSPAGLGWRAPRPTFSPLGSERGALLPSLDDALERYVRELSSDGSFAASAAARTCSAAFRPAMNA